MDLKERASRWLRMDMLGLKYDFLLSFHRLISLAYVPVSALFLSFPPVSFPYFFLAFSLWLLNLDVI